MRAALALAILLPLQALAAGPLGAVQRMYSNVTSNKAWRIDFVGCTDGKLVDQTGTLVSKADIEYLQAVNEGLTNVLAAGEAAFRRAEAEFRAALEENPPGPSTFLSMIIPPYSDRTPDNRNPYGMLIYEGADYLGWYLSKPFTMEPGISVQDIYTRVDGTVVTSYQAAAWIDYLPDATNMPAPHVKRDVFSANSNDVLRVCRMTDPDLPTDAKTGTDGGYPVVIRDSQLHFGHPDHGINFGGMLLDVVDSNGNVRHTVTGTYTNVIGGVRYEVVFTRGAMTKRAPIGETP